MDAVVGLMAGGAGGGVTPMDMRRSVALRPGERLEDLQGVAVERQAGETQQQFQARNEAAATKKRQLDEAQGKKFMGTLLENMSSFFAGRQNRPAVDLAQQKGYNLAKGYGGAGGAALGKGTGLPEDPFEEGATSAQNFGTMVAGLSPHAHQMSEGILDQVRQMAPEGIRALKNVSHGANFYEGVSDVFDENYLHILLQRKRENSLYAFV